MGFGLSVLSPRSVLSLEVLRVQRLTPMFLINASAELRTQMNERVSTSPYAKCRRRLRPRPTHVWVASGASPVSGRTLGWGLLWRLTPHLVLVCDAVLARPSAQSTASLVASSQGLRSSAPLALRYTRGPGVDSLLRHVGLRVPQVYLFDQLALPSVCAWQNEGRSSYSGSYSDCWL